MDRVLSTHLNVQNRLTTAWLDRVADAGIPAVEMFCARQHVDYYSRAQVSELGHWFRDADLRLHSLHLPIFNDDRWGRTGPSAVVNITEPVKAKRIAHVDEIKRALEIAETIPCRFAVQHLGHTTDTEYDDRRLESAFTSLEEIRLFAKARGVEVLLENIPNVYSSGAGLVSFLQQTHLDLGFCLDVGHAHLMEGVEAAFEAMRERIRSTHVHDNDGQSDSHLFPMMGQGGSIDWEKTMALLRSGGAQWALLLELKEQPGMENLLASAVEVFDRLEQA